MDFTIPDELMALKEQLTRFVKKEILPFEEKYKLIDEAPYEVHMQVRRRSREVGFYGIHLPEEVGGQGLSNLGLCILIEELRMLGAEHFGSEIIGGPGGPTPILLACNERQREKYLKPLMRAEITTCFALTEPEAGSDASAIRTRAVRSGDHYILNGRKHYITNAPFADFAMVFAKTDPKKGPISGISCFLVDKGTPGFSVGNIHQTMTSSGQHAELVFEDCRVPTENLLGEEGKAFLYAMRWINQGRIGIGANCVGGAQRFLNMAVNYARTRVQFGRPIGDYQAIQWMLADMAIEVYAARVMVYSAAWKLDHGMEVRKEACIAKLYASEMVNRAADRALQIFGGMGFMKEAGIERGFRISRAARIGEGTSEIQRLTIARQIIKEAKGLKGTGGIEDL